MANHERSPLLIATNNQGKIKELHELLDDLGIELLTPARLNLNLDVVEDGLTYAENASKKAIAFAQASGLISLADDSGLEVDALHREPGLYSARYGSDNGEKLSDAGRRAYLLQQLQNKARPWTARFHATIAIAVPMNNTSNVILPKAVSPRRARSPNGEHRGGVSEATPAPNRTPPRWFGAGGCGEGPNKSLTVIQPNENIYLAEGWCEGEIIPEERGAGGFGYDPIFLLPELGKTMAELSMDEKNRLSHRARAVMNARLILEQLLSKTG
jgi:XTP/dITP diphosphohydrolase